MQFRSKLIEFFFSSKQHRKHGRTRYREIKHPILLVPVITSVSISKLNGQLQCWVACNRYQSNVKWREGITFAPRVRRLCVFTFLPFCLFADMDAYSLSMDADADTADVVVVVFYSTVCCNNVDALMLLSFSLSLSMCIHRHLRGDTLNQATKTVHAHFVSMFAKATSRPMFQ